jgi:hypothetical protein
MLLARNNAATNDPCYYCGTRTDPLSGLKSWSAPRAAGR